MQEAVLDLSDAKRKIVSFVKNKIEESQTDGVVLGISGGIDSAVVAYLCVEALGSRRVAGLIMPDLRVTPEDDITDARSVANELCVETKEVDIARIHKAFLKGLESNRLAEGNLRARIRMALLYYYANTSNRLVAGTGDRSELMLGYFTKYGDGGVDILPIADLYKTQVRQLAEILGISRSIISKKSSPRLWTGQLAEAEIGLSYDTIDQVFAMFFDQGLDVKAIATRLKLGRAKVEDLLKRCERTAHKRRMPEICILH